MSHEHDRSSDAPFPSTKTDVGRLMRAHAWETTPLGSPRSWPESLRSALGICADSGFPIAIYWGPELALLYNDAWSPILGSKHPWGLGRAAREVWPEIWDTVGPLFDHVLTTGEATYSVDQLLPMRRHGYVEECYFNYTFSPIRGAGGRVEGVFNAVVETTYRVIGERRTRLLRELGERLASARAAGEAASLAVEVLGGAPKDVAFCAVYLVSDDGRSARLAGASGLEPGGPASPERVTLDDDAAAPWPFAQAKRSGRVEVVTDLAARFARALPGGAWPEPATAALVAPIITGTSDQPAGFVVLGASPRRAIDEEYRQFAERAASHVATAVANAKAYEAERSRAEALAAIDRAKTLFFSDISHEFRTPLTLILGPVEDALASPERTLGGEALDAVHASTRRLLKLVNALLDFARIEAGRARARHVPTDLAKLTAQLASAFEPAFARAGLAFEIDCPPLPDPVFVDHDMWEKIVSNLLSNALKFTLEGRVRIALRPDARDVVLEVSDTGTGIPEAELPRIFERFHRVHGARSRTHEGSGIGLALVHELSRLHGGSVTASSRLDEGTRFTVRIPRGSAHLPAEHVAAPRELASTTTGAAAYVEEALRWLPAGDAPVETIEPAERDGVPGAILPDARILLADDNADMRAYVGRVLGARWLVEAVCDGEAAFEAARRSRPDLVVTDVMMPKLDGFGLLRALREDPATEDIPVVILSARAGDESRAEGLERGADDYVVKPFSARELVARVATHLQLAQLRRSAVAEREKMYALFEQTPIAIAVFRGPEHVYELANARYLALSGRRALVGLRARDAFPELPDHDFWSNLDRVYATGEPAVADEVRADLDRGNGPEPRFFSYSLHVLRDPDGSVGRVVQVVADITERVLARKRLETAATERAALLAQAEEARREAEAANLSKDEFLAMLGHELRNPLAPITTALHLMRLRAGGIAERERSVIERQVGHLATLVDDLLDVSRITRGKVKLERERVEIADVLAKAIELASPLLEQRRHHLSIDVAARGVAVSGDVTRLAQVISNLLTNAAKYTEPGGRIEVAAERAGGDIVLRVRDSGIGIAPEMLPKVFDLFVQERQAIDRSQGGLGLGLAIVKSLVAAHGGTVTVASEGKGRGSTFAIRLPAAEPATEAAAPLEAPRSAQAARATSPRKRVLIVDDNQDAAELLAEMLGELGYETRVAHDGPSALRIAEAFVPEVALLDIGLPVMDGYELARRLREHPVLARSRLIAVTGYGQEEDRRRSQLAGFDLHLAKPVPLEGLEAFLSDPASAAE